MKVRVTKRFLWAPDGNTVRAVEVGEVLEEQGAEVAMSLRACEVIEEKSLSSAPMDKSVRMVPKNKGR